MSIKKWFYVSLLIFSHLMIWRNQNFIVFSQGFMAAGGFSRIYAGIGGDQIDLYFNEFQDFCFWLKLIFISSKKFSTKIEMFATQVQLQWARLRTLLFSFAPMTQSRSKQLESECFYLFFCTYDTIKKQAFRKWEFLSFLLHLRHNQGASNWKVSVCKKNCC